MPRWARTALLISLTLLLTVGFTVEFLCPVGHAVSVQTLRQRRSAKSQEIERIRHLKRQIILKERAVTNNIVRNQRRLDTTKSSLQVQQTRYATLRGEMVDLEADLDVAIADYKDVSDKIGKRIRQLYMDERLSQLHMFLDAGNVSTLLDRIYYKERIMKQDKALFNAYVAKVKELEAKKKALAQRKTQLAQTIHAIESYQNELKEAVHLDRMMVNKLESSLAAYEAAQRQLERESNAIEQQILSMIARSGGGNMRSNGRFMRPVLAGITSPFGYRIHPIFRRSKLHTGTDFGAGYGATVRAAGPGTVIYAGWKGGYGKVVMINHGSFRGRNITTLYGHLSATQVGPGQSVGMGQSIGNVGSTGFSTGAHLHFEVRENGHPVNPMAYLR